MGNIQTAITFDMRSPEWASPTRELYAAAIEMAAFADQIGVDSINMTEHHGSEDGYLPQPFLLATALAAVTKTIKLHVGAVLVPLHDPVEVAEQIAVADLISDGRLAVTLGAGYVESEFALFKKSLGDRAKSMESGIEMILRALHGERFESDGRDIFIRPLPTRAPEEFISVGGGVAASARRAARFDLGFVPMNADHVDLYIDECHRLGREPRSLFKSESFAPLPMCVHLCEDPDAGWKAIERHAMHAMNEYAKWTRGSIHGAPYSEFSDPAALRAAGAYVAWTPDELLSNLSEVTSGLLNFQPLLSGLSPEEGWKSLKLLKATLPLMRTLA